MFTIPDPIRLTMRLRERSQVPAGPAFEDLGRIQQLDAIDRACRDPFYVFVLAEALPQSDGYSDLLQMLTDSCVTDAAIGAKAREILIGYMQRVAEQRGDDLVSFARE